MSEQSQNFINSILKISDFFQSRPDLETPYIEQMYCFVYKKEDLVTVARQLGKCEKGADDNFFFLRKTFGGITITWNLARNQVCKRVEVGKRSVPEKIIPAQVIAAHEETIYEWHCEEPLLAGTSATEVVKELETVETVAQIEEIPFSVPEKECARVVRTGSHRRRTMRKKG